MAARTAWVGGVIIFLMGLVALMQFAEWEEWIALIVGALVIIAPWALGFAAIHAAMWSCVVLGVIVVLVLDLGDLGRSSSRSDSGTVRSV